MKIKYILYALIFAIILYYANGYFFSKKRKLNGTTFYIARDPQWHPLDLMGKEVDIQIFCDTLMHQIADDQGINIVIQSIRNEYLLPGLTKQQFDAIAYPIVEKWENFGRYYFSDPMFALGPVLVVRIDEKDGSFADFKGKTIGVVRNSPLLNKMNSIPDINVAPYDKLFEGLESLINNRLDGFVMDALPAYLYSEGFFKGKLKIKKPALTKAGIKLIALQNPRAREFFEAFNQGLATFIQDGRYQALLDQWQFTNYPLPLIHTNEMLQADDGLTP